MRACEKAHRSDTWRSGAAAGAWDQNRGTLRVLYHWYELGRAAFRPARAAADSCRLFFNPLNPLTHTPVGRSAIAACEVFERATRRYAKPDFGIAAHQGRRRSRWRVTEEVVWQTPFCRLVHFKRDIDPARAPRSTRACCWWRPCRATSPRCCAARSRRSCPTTRSTSPTGRTRATCRCRTGRFDLDDYIDTMADMFRFFGGDVHVFAVCQPSVPVLAATALMEADGDPAVPLSLILAGGPIDTRINPTVVNTLAEKRGTDWFRRNVITNVPWPCPGRGRQVYPGFLQLSGFMTMNLDRHMQAHKDMFLHLVHGDGDSADKHREFYDEYLAVMDLTAEFYLQTVDTVFVQHLMPRGLMTLARPARRSCRHPPAGADDGRGREGRHHRHRPVPRRARSVHRHSRRAARLHFECPRVGHYGVFNGSRFRTEIAPRMAKFMRAHDPCAASDLTIAQLEHMATMPRRGRRAQELEGLAFSFAAE